MDFFDCSALLSPRSCNTGAENTGRDSRALIDWLSGTLVRESGPERVYEFLGLDPGLFCSMTRGFYGYPHGSFYEGIFVLWGSGSVHFILSGTGCRFLERNGIDWFAFLASVYRMGGHLTRLDLAFDDLVFTGMPLFTLDQLRIYLKKGFYRTRFRSAHISEELVLQGDVPVSGGLSIYFGSSSSRIRFRVYEKHLERLAKGYALVDGLLCWNRFEVQMRDERANRAAQLLLAGESVSDLLLGIVKHYLLFLDPVKDTNKARWPVAGFWQDFLGAVERVRLADLAPDLTVERVRRWLDRQVAPSLGLDYLVYYLEMGSYDSFLQYCVSRMTEKHRKAFIQYLESRQKKEEEIRLC